jgi:transketolase
MEHTEKSIEQLSINTIRFLAVDAIQKANSGHPGMPMGCAPIGYLLYKEIMSHNPNQPKWLNRDRFILSAGHGSMLLYSLLHLSGYNLSLDDLKNFRQWGSVTPGHPEFGLTDGVETTTGPLGQGLSNAIGMAVAEKYLAAKFNKYDYTLIDHHIYVIASDGDLMEGVTHESCSYAGHNKLDSLIVFYDCNSITIDGKLDLAMSEDVGKRFEGYGWHVQHVTDVNDLEQLRCAVKNAQSENARPSIIITNTHIGFGSPNKQDTSGVHGSPLGDEEIKLTKKNLGWNYEEDFYVPAEVAEHFSEVKLSGENLYSAWREMFEEYSKKYPAEAELLDSFSRGTGIEVEIDEFTNYGEKAATRSASGAVINSIAANLPQLIGGSADLAPSNNTYIKAEADFSPADYSGRNFHFGIREHGMASIMNGICYYGGLIPYGGTFLVFSDYLRPAIRLASMSHLRPIYIFTHDSIGLGEDGPTHQPVEHLSSLRAIPGLVVIRPADSNETVYAWKAALKNDKSPTAIILTRQKLRVIDRNKYGSADGVLKGAYILKEASGGLDSIIIATGSEVEIALDAAEKLEAEGKSVRVVSMPSCELFEMQSDSYKESVLPKKPAKKIAIEAGVSHGWHKYADEVISIEKFGASAPYNTLYEKYGLTAEAIVEKLK